MLTIKLRFATGFLNNEAEAKIYFEKAKTIGRDQADPDKNRCDATSRK